MSIINSIAQRCYERVTANLKRVRPKLMRKPDLSRCLLDRVLPVPFPPAIGTVEASGQQVFSVLPGPPSAGAFQPLLDDIARGAFEFPGAAG